MSTSTHLENRDRAQPFPAPGRVSHFFLERSATYVGLWVAVVLLCVLDITTTYYGLQIGFIEANPLARAGLSEFGVWSMVLLKGLALGYGAVVAAELDRLKSFIPLVLLVIWGLAVVSNAQLILPFV